MQNLANRPKHIFRVCFFSFLGLFVFMLMSSVLYRAWYIPLDYRLNSYYPLLKWQEYLSSQEGTSKLWGNSGFLGAFPYRSGGTVIFHFTYPFKIGAVRISDQHNQWGDGDIVKMWTSTDGATWTLRYHDTQRDTVVEYAQDIEVASSQSSQLFIKYELYAGDQNRAPDDNRGASVRGLQVTVALRPAFLMIIWNAFRYLLLPLLATLALLFWLLSITPPVRKLEMLSILVLLILALAFRIGFLLSVRHIPVFADAYYYNTGALDLLSTLMHPDKHAIFETLRGLYAKGPIYNLFLSGIYLLFGDENFMAIRIAQAVIDTLTGLLVYFMARSLGNWRTGLLAGGLYAFYMPFLVATDRLLQETVALFLLTLTIFLFLNVAVVRSSRWNFGAGCCLGLTVLCRPALNYLFIPVIFFSLLVMLWEYKSSRPPGCEHRDKELFRPACDARRRLVFQVIAICLGILVTIGPWILLAHVFFHDAMLIFSKQRYYIYFYKGLSNHGWQQDVTPLEPGSPLDALLHERGQTTPTETDLRDVVITTLKTDPLNAIATSLHNFYYYWARPYNDFFQRFLIPLPIQYLYHRLIVLLALWGSIFAGPRWRQSFFVVLPVCYVALVQAIDPVELRHALPAFPFVMVLSAYAVFFLGAKILTIVKGRDQKLLKLVGLVVIAGGLYLVSNMLTVPFLLSEFPQISARSAHFLTLFLMNSFWVALGMLTYFIVASSDLRKIPAGPLQKQWFKRLPWEHRRRLGYFCVAFGPVCFIALVANTHIALTAQWREWKICLDKPNLKIQQRIVLPARLPDFTEAYLKFDLQGGAGHNYDLVIRANGQEIQRYRRGLAADSETIEYLTYAYRGTYQLYMNLQGRTPKDLRQWFTVPVDRTLLRSQNMLEVELQLVNGGGRPHDVELYGDYLAAAPEIPQDLPAFGLGTTKTSLYKYIVDDDFRLWTQAEVKNGHASVSRIGVENEFSKDYLIRWQRYLPPVTMKSRFFDGNRWREDDLSPERGKQFGQYRIRLLLKDKTGNYLVL